MDKQTEIKTLKSLIGDTYFNQFFSKEEIGQMCENISNDFGIEFGIEKLEAVRRLADKQKDYDNISKRLEDCMEENDRKVKELDEITYFIADKAHLLHSHELRAKAIEIMGEESEYIKYSLRKGYELWKEDKELLIKIL